MTNKEKRKKEQLGPLGKNKGLQKLTIINNLLLIYILTHFESKYLQIFQVGHYKKYRGC